VFFVRCLDEATSAGVVPVIPMVLAERGLVAIGRDDWSEAEALAARALAIIEGGEFDDYWTSALVYAWGARVAAKRGDVAEARHLVVRAARLRTLLTYALPIVSAQALLQMAHAYVALADAGGAQAVLKQIHDIHQHRRDLGSLVDEADGLRATLTTITNEMVGVSSLTTAEMRLLPLLPTHLSLEAIAERLFVSRNTVKSQTISIYRKLGVSSRGETIERLQHLGFAGHV
jgi:LuxR family maltose regulon positive regulatory protein